MIERERLKTEVQHVKQPIHEKEVAEPTFEERVLPVEERPAVVESQFRLSVHFALSQCLIVVLQSEKLQ